MTDEDAVLRRFGESAGIPGLAFHARNHVVFRTVATGRIFGLERSNHEILVYVMTPLDYDAGSWLLRAYRRAHYSRSTGAQVQPALREIDNKRHLLVLTRMSKTEFDETRLQQAFDFLVAWLDSLSEEVY